MLVVPVAAGLVMTACNKGNDEGGKFDIKLSGADEVCADNAKCGGNGSGEATIEINSDRNRVCYDIKLDGMKDVTAAHIHDGEKGKAGPVVVNLNYSGTDSGGQACVDGVSESVLEKVSKDPDKHYLNVHTKTYPDGAARGQLKD
jgi:CHRD domain-containing protein